MGKEWVGRTFEVKDGPKMIAVSEVGRLIDFEVMSGPAEGDTITLTRFVLDKYLSEGLYVETPA